VRDTDSVIAHRAGTKSCFADAQWRLMGLQDIGSNSGR
jgi:hypothetical protein